jgi:hypothetical protein
MNHFFAFHDTCTSVSILPHIINQTEADIIIDTVCDLIGEL